jgi:hypothetical protein
MTELDIERAATLQDHRPLDDISELSLPATRTLISFPYPVGSDGTIVNSARDPVIVGTGLSEVSIHELERLVAHVHAGENAERVHFRACRRTDAVELANRQPFHEAWPHLRRDRVLAVGLAVIGGEFREKLVVRDTGRCVEASLGLDFFPDSKRDVPCQRDAL